MDLLDQLTPRDYFEIDKLSGVLNFLASSATGDKLEDPSSSAVRHPSYLEHIPLCRSLRMLTIAEQDFLESSARS